MANRQRELGIFLMMASIIGNGSSRMVHVPRGPLYRVEGTHVFIPCNVTDYEGSSAQDFEWSVSKPDAPFVAVGVVSTRDPRFHYAMYGPRVRAGEIYIHRLSADSAELHLTDFRREDEGEYECYTPSTDRRHLGMYSAKVQLKVLPDTLQLAGPPGPPAHLSLSEGEPLTLKCHAVSLAALHTHLSVTFSLNGSRTRGPQAVIGIGRDLTVQSQELGTYWARYARGQIGIEKVKGDSYHLRIDHMKTEDGGTYYCEAVEWIQDPNGRWQKILEKAIPLAIISVQPIDLKLRATASVAPSMFYRGDTVELQCNVTLGRGQAEAELQLAVGWWAEEDDALALVDRLGVSQPTALRGRTLSGSELSADRPAAHCFRLRIHGAKSEDQRSYHCQVICWARSQGKGWYQAATAQSEPLTLFLYLSPSDTLLIPIVAGVVISLTVTVTIISAVTCCFLRRLAKR